MKLLPSPHRSSSFQKHDVSRQPLVAPKRLVYGGIALGTFLLIVWAFRPAPLRVDVATVQRSSLQVTVDAEGKTRIRDRFVIAAPVSGHLDRIALEPGDPVKPGTRVAWIDPLPLNAAVQEAVGRLAEAQAQRQGVATLRPKQEQLTQAQTRISAAAAAQRQAEARVDQAQAALVQAQRDRQRAQQLYTEGVISRKDREAAELNETTRVKDLEAARLASRAASAEVQEAKAALSVLEAEQQDPDYLLRVYDARIASIEAELSKLRDQARRTEIRSPTGGKVLRVLQESAQFVAEGTPLLELGDPGRLELVIDVLSTDAQRIQPGDPILIHSGPETAPWQARVRRVEPAAFTETSALGVEEQRVNVIGNFVQIPSGLGDAYRVDAQIVVWDARNVVSVPLSALFRCGRNWCVFTLQGDRIYRQAVTVGHRSNHEAEIRQGLNVGGTVILHPTDQMEQGKRVSIR